MASLLVMSDWGGTDAESLKTRITNLFSGTGSIPLDVEDFKMKLVCCASDGGSAHFWSENRSNEQPWMIKIHCVNHHVIREQHLNVC